VIAQPPQVIVVNSGKVQATSVKDLIAYAKANPGKLNYASAGNGSSHHLAGELFKLQTQTDLIHVPYKGAGPALSDLIAGQVDLMFDGLGSSSQHIRAGRIKALAVASKTRSAAFPNVPTAAEAGLPNYDVSTWYALWAPKGTPKEVVDRLYAETTKALNNPEMKQIWLQNGSDIPQYTPEQFAQFEHAEIKRWADVVQRSGAKID
jgi:tripartite-type tricarboxylate transporter receptor subunit TctC